RSASSTARLFAGYCVGLPVSIGLSSNVQRKFVTTYRREETFRSLKPVPIENKEDIPMSSTKLKRKISFGFIILAVLIFSLVIAVMTLFIKLKEPKLIPLDKVFTSGIISFKMIVAKIEAICFGVMDSRLEVPFGQHPAKQPLMEMSVKTELASKGIHIMSVMILLLWKLT
ncbi:MAG: hypothetical protein EZS28_047332, partial [Streblomastix strix]